MDRALKSALSSASSVAISLGLVALFALTAGCSGPGPRVADNPDAALTDSVRQSDLLARRAQAPDEPYWPHEIAALRLAAGDRAAARAYLDTALALDRDFAPAVVLRSRLAYEDGRHADAVDLLQAYLDRRPDAPDAIRVALALNLQALQDPEQSTSLLAACADDDATLETARVMAQLSGPEFKTSLAAASAAVAHTPRSAANHNNYGIALLYAGRPTDARVAFLRALELQPELPGALYNLAIVENFYFFDATAGRNYFQRYQAATRRQVRRDPDDLASVLGADTVAIGPAAARGEGDDEH